MNTYLLWSIFKPSSIILYTSILGIVLYKKPAGRALLLLASIMLTCCALLPIGALLTTPLETRYPRPEPLAAVNGIIVLAGSEVSALTAKYHEPMLNSAGDRLTTFLRLAYQFPEARLVHAGSGPQYDGISQSDVARKIILGSGVDASRIVFSDDSRNTCEDARLAFKTIQPAINENWLLVTSAYHMPRAVACFNAANWAVTPYAADYTFVDPLQTLSLTTNLITIDRATYEWIALIYYRLSGRTKEIYPKP